MYYFSLTNKSDMPFTFSVLAARSPFLVVVFLLTRLAGGHLRRYSLCVIMG